ncbi:hypothetical protein [Halospeciosus flavus]|uniref:DUF7857 domain-containing protein n=1 Tax=Halospeciosus flavus TaxID=3032283 RepID=UPI00360F9728
MRLDCDTTERDGVTLVACLLTNDGDDPRRARVANRLDGPVWFPRVDGVPVRGWDDGGYEGVLGPGRRDRSGTRPQQQQPTRPRRSSGPSERHTEHERQRR